MKDVAFLMSPAILLFLVGIWVWRRWPEPWRNIALIPAVLFAFGIYCIAEMGRATEFSGFKYLGEYVIACGVAYLVTFGLMAARYANRKPEKRRPPRPDPDGEPWWPS